MADLGLEYIIPYLDERLGIIWDMGESYILAVRQAGHLLSTNVTQQDIVLFSLALLIALAVIALSSRPLGMLKFKYSLLFCWKDLLAMMEKRHCQPLLLRLAFADAASYDHTVPDWPHCGGCNGSIRFDSELGETFNAGLAKAISILAPYKAKYGLSWADLIQMAGVAAVYSTGGPLIELQYGREDVDVDLREELEEWAAAPFGPPPVQSSTDDLRCLLSGPVPSSASTPPSSSCFPLPAMVDYHIRHVFYRMGLNNKEMVSLMGAHTLGRAFSDRTGVCPFSSGDQGATVFTKMDSNPHGTLHPTHADIGMPGGCSWTKNWLQFDNSYYQRPYKDPYNKDLLWLPSDQAVFTSPECTKYFELFAAHQDCWFEEYAAVHKKMSELGARFNKCMMIPLS